MSVLQDWYAAERAAGADHREAVRRLAHRIGEPEALITKLLRDAEGPHKDATPAVAERRRRNAREARRGR